MEWNQEREDSAKRARKRENNRFRGMLISVLTDIPDDQWKQEVRKAIRTYGDVERRILTAKAGNGASVKLVREMLLQPVSDEDRAKYEVDYNRKYQLNFDRMLVGSERYLEETPPGGTIGALFETLLVQLKHQ